MTRTTKYLLAFAALAYIAALASVAYGTPLDALAALWNGLISGADPTLGPSGGAVLAFGPLVRGLQAKHADTVASLKAIVDSAEAEGRDLTAEEQKVFDAHKAEAASLKARIARAQETELAEAGIAAQAGAAPGARAGVTIPAHARISVEENVDADPQRGFTSFGEFAQAVRGATWRPVWVRRWTAGSLPWLRWDRWVRRPAPSAVKAPAPTAACSCPLASARTSSR